jgi:predicted lipoprotein with Yx(FWY)xxD motif
MIDADRMSTIAGQRQETPRPRRGRRSTSVVWCGAAAVLAATVSFAAVALAGGSAVTVGSASSSKLGKQIVINTQGRTLYALSPETTHHLLCTGGECLKFWPPLTVPAGTKLKAGPGVQGHLAILHRHGGLLQVTLRGMPLYRYSRDHARGQVNGEGIESFGGTWHAVSAQAGASSTPPASNPPTMTTPTTTTPSYGY